MTPLVMVVAGTGAAVVFATAVAAGVAALGRALGPREWRLDHPYRDRRKGPA